MPQPALIVTALLSLLFLLAAIGHRLPPGLDPWQATGIVLGAWNTWLTALRSLWTWPVGIAGCLIFAGVFGRARLYGALFMQLFYVCVSLLGWRWWLRGGRGHTPLPVSRAPQPLLLLLTSLALAATPAVALLLGRAHDPSPTLDALAAALSLTAQFLVMRKWVENWYFWIAADAVSVALYATRGMPVFSLLYTGHGVMCAYGLWRWRTALPVTVGEAAQV